MLKKALSSPTITTWMSYSTRALSLFGLLPLILNKFTTGDVALWYLFSTIISLQVLADFGFRQTFSRVISFAFAGAADVNLSNQNSAIEITNKSNPNIRLLNRITSLMKYLYKRLSVILFILMCCFGTWAMVKPIRESSNILEAWLAWCIVLGVSCVSFYGKIYLNFLEGLFKVALVRKVETITSIGTILSGILVLVFSPSLLNLIIANQFWVLVVVYRDRQLCMKVENGLYKIVSKKLPFNKKILS